MKISIFLKNIIFICRILSFKVSDIIYDFVRKYIQYTNNTVKYKMDKMGEHGDADARYGKVDK